MKDMNKTFNLYCDESTHLENDGKPYMLISYIGSPYIDKDNHSKFIKGLKLKHGFKGEIKWTGVSSSGYPFFAELVDYFFSSSLYYRSVIVEKNQIHNELPNFNFDEFYYKMYYQLLHHKMDMSSAYNVYIDIKDTRGAKKIKRLADILNIKYGRIRNIQLIHSYESNLMQLCDLIMGALNYYLRGEHTVEAKNKIIAKISKNADLPLDKSTSKWNDKFNLFFIDLNGNH